MLRRSSGTLTSVYCSRCRFAGTKAPSSMLYKSEDCSRSRLILPELEGREGPDMAPTVLPAGKLDGMKAGRSVVSSMLNFGTSGGEAEVRSSRSIREIIRGCLVHDPTPLPGTDALINVSLIV